MDHPILPIILIVLLFIAVLLIIVLILSKTRHPSARTEFPAPPDDLQASYEFRTYEELIAFDKNSLTEKDQSQDWQTAMQKVGARFKQAGISDVFFVHGTFVGQDPFDLVKLVKSSFPAGDRFLQHKLLLSLS